MFAGLYASAFHAAYRLLGDRVEAEDVAQEACTRACLRWDRILKRGAPRPWIVRKSTDLALRRYRSRVRAANNPETTEEVAPAADERRVDLHRALATLPRRQRRAVVLRYIGDLSEDDTADVLGWDPYKVDSRATRGLATMRQELDGGPA